MSRFYAAAIVAVALLTSRPSVCGGEAATLSWLRGLPVYDHVVIVVEENKDYEEIIGNRRASYINDVLRTEGATFTKMYGEEHNSQGNYFWLFSGSNQSVGFADDIPTAENNPNFPFTASNLGQQLILSGRTFKGYAESLPEIGFDRPFSDDHLYARKHAPWISFKNVPNGSTASTSSNLRFVDFPAEFRQLPTVAFVIPNLDNDMHNGNPQERVPIGDAWLKKNLNSYYQWAKQNNSLLILTFDESNDRGHFRGLTTPLEDTPQNQQHRDVQNRIATIFAGASIKPGEYSEGKGITHVNILRTLEAMYGLPKSGAQQPNAVGAGISDDFIITDVFQ